MEPTRSRKEKVMSNELEKSEKDLQEALVDLTKAEKEVAEAEKKLPWLPRNDLL